MHGVAAKVAEKVAVLFQQRDLDPRPGQQQPQYHSGRSAADHRAGRRLRHHSPDRRRTASAQQFRVHVVHRNRFAEYPVLLDVAIPQPEQLGELVGVGGGEVVDLAPVAGQVVELPGAGAIGRGR